MHSLRQKALVLFASIVFAGGLAGCGARSQSPTMPDAASPDGGSPATGESLDPPQGDAEDAEDAEDAMDNSEGNSMSWDDDEAGDEASSDDDSEAADDEYEYEDDESDDGDDGDDDGFDSYMDEDGDSDSEL